MPFNLFYILIKSITFTLFFSLAILTACVMQNPPHDMQGLPVFRRTSALAVNPLGCCVTHGAWL